MACEELESELASLREKRREQRQIMQHLQGAGLEAAEAQLAAIEADIARTEAALEECRSQPASVGILSMSVARIHCIQPTKEIDRDEPYVLVTAADIGSILPVVDTFKYGPWADVKKGDTRDTLFRPPLIDDATWSILSKGKVIAVPFWGIDGKPRAISNVQNVIFVVSLVEHEAASDADALRVIVKAAALGSLSASANRRYDVRVKRLINAISDALATPTGPNPDDEVGTKHLSLEIADTTGPAGTTRDKTLSGFTMQKASYTVTCRITYG